MSQTNGQHLSSRLESLVGRHEALSRVLEEEYKHPVTSEWEIKRLKRQKLKLKDNIEQIRMARSE